MHSKKDLVPLSCHTWRQINIIALGLIKALHVLLDTYLLAIPIKEIHNDL